MGYQGMACNDLPTSSASRFSPIAARVLRTACGVGIAITIIFGATVACAAKDEQQSELQNPAPTEQTPSNPTATGVQQGDFDRIATGLREVVALSSSLSQWAFLLLGGSLATVLSTSYHKPPWPWRLAYFVFLPAFCYLAFVLERGSRVQGAYVAMLLRPRTREALTDALAETNRYLLQQVDAFQTAAIWLGMWIVVYLGWWIIGDTHRSQAAGSSE
jgi:hypothetical protein